jgi:hypothetical protein
VKQRNKNPKTQTHVKPEPTRTRPKPQAPTPEQIQKRAYEIYETRNGAPGCDLVDWLKAERELKAEAGHPLTTAKNP